MLFGDALPSGRLSHSWPKAMQQIPINFGDENYAPLFEYGHGMTSFADSPIGSPPQLFSAATNEDGSEIGVTFNKAMADPSAGISSFTVVVNDAASPIQLLSLKNNDSTTLVLTLAQSIEPGDVVELSYQAGAIHSADGGMLESFADYEVYNLLNSSSTVAIVPGRIEAENYNRMQGVQTENTTDIGGGLNVGWIDNNDWMQYDVNVKQEGTFQLALRIASLSQSGKITLSSSLSGVLARVNLPITGGWQNWQTVVTEVQLQKGQQTLSLIATTGGFNINWLEFTLQTEVNEPLDQIFSFQLHQNYPNPFNSSTAISYQLAASCQVEIAIFDLLGKKVFTLIDENQPAGNYRAEVDAAELASGIYFYQIKAGDFAQTRKMIVLR